MDAQVRKELRRWLRELQHELNVTSIFVTHDQDEALDMSDRIVVMNKGQVEQIDEPSQIYHAPQTPFVTQFVGDVNVFHGHIDQGNLVNLLIIYKHIAMRLMQSITNLQRLIFALTN